MLRSSSVSIPEIDLSLHDKHMFDIVRSILDYLSPKLDKIGPFFVSTVLLHCPACLDLDKDKSLPVKSNTTMFFLH